MQTHSKTKNQLLTELSTDQKNGLSNKQVAERKEKYGLNKLHEKKKKTILQRFFAEFKDAMILILLAAAAISFVLACIKMVCQKTP